MPQQQTQKYHIRTELNPADEERATESEAKDTSLWKLIVIFGVLFAVLVVWVDFH